LDAELAQGIGVTQRDIWEIGIGAYLRQNFPRARAFAALGLARDDAHTMDIIQMKRAVRRCPMMDAGLAGNRDLSPINVFDGVKEIGVSDVVAVKRVLADVEVERRQFDTS
jgi:hypothetical protein